MSTEALQEVRNLITKSVVEPLAKASSSYSGGGDSSAKEQNDPAQQKTTETEVSAQAIAQASGDSAVGSNLASLRKAVEDRAAALSKALEGLKGDLAEGPLAELARAEIAKAGPATSKLDEVKALFKIDDSKLRDEYDLRWKISELVCALQQASKLEEILEVPAAKAESKEPASKADAWPRDMAAAQFDAKAGVYKSDDPSWGRDPSAG